MRHSLLIGLALILCLAFGQVAYAQFSDNPTADNWVYEEFKLVYDAGLIKGYPDGTFKGERPATRYEVVAFMARLLTYFEGQIQSVYDAIPPEQQLPRILTEDEVKAMIKDALDANNASWQQQLASADYATNSDVNSYVDQLYQAIRFLETSLRGDLDKMDVRVTTLEGQVDQLQAKDVDQDASIAQLQADLASTNSALEDAKAQAAKDAADAMKQAKKATSLSIVGIILGILGIFLP